MILIFCHENTLKIFNPSYFQEKYGGSHIFIISHPDIFNYLIRLNLLNPLVENPLVLDAFL